jgi:hypothetical protein
MDKQYETLYDNIPMQGLFTEKIKKPLLEGIEEVFSGNPVKVPIGITKLAKVISHISEFPAPSLEDAWNPTTKNLIIIRDWLMERLDLHKQRKGFVQRIFNIAIIITHYDHPWRYIIDKTREKAFELEWKPAGYKDGWRGWYRWWHEDSED